MSGTHAGRPVEHREAALSSEDKKSNATVTDSEDAAQSSQSLTDSGATESGKKDADTSGTRKRRRRRRRGPRKKTNPGSDSGDDVAGSSPAGETFS